MKTKTSETSADAQTGIERGDSVRVPCMSGEDVAARLERLNEKATPGPWDAPEGNTVHLTFDKEINVYPPDTFKTHGFQYGGPVCVVQDNGEAKDAPLIVALRNIAPALPELIRAGRALRHDSACQTKYRGGACNCGYARLRAALDAVEQGGAK